MTILRTAPGLPVYAGALDLIDRRVGTPLMRSVSLLLSYFIGIGIENTEAGLQSQILMSADRFALVNSLAGGGISTPFVAQGGQLFLGPTFIQDGTITNAKIGSFISSTNYIAGQQGWILNKDGTLEINGIVPGQGRLVINAQNVSVYDVNNVLRVRLGYLG